MTRETPPDRATLLDVLIDGFEKNEVMRNFHWRDLPFANEEAAARSFAALTAEGRRWKGEPERFEGAGPRRIAVWPDLEIRQAGRGVMVRARAPWFDWWNTAETWNGDPLAAVHEWTYEDTKVD